MKIAITGHRPDKLPGGYKDCYKIILPYFTKMFYSLNKNYDVIYTGGALGIDQIALKAAILLNIKCILCEPFEGFYKKWPNISILNYLDLKNKLPLENIIIVGKTNNISEYQKRNEFMVDSCDELWCWWSGEKGGTANCVEYAKKVGKPIYNLFSSEKKEI